MLFYSNSGVLGGKGAVICKSFMPKFKQNLSLINGWVMINSSGGMILRFIRITFLLQEHGNVVRNQKYWGSCVCSSNKAFLGLLFFCLAFNSEHALYQRSNEVMENYARMHPVW